MTARPQERKRNPRLQPTGEPAHQWVECVHCLNADRNEWVDVRDWAEGHERDHPGHITYRVVNATTWVLRPKPAEAATTAP